MRPRAAFVYVDVEAGGEGAAMTACESSCGSIGSSLYAGSSAARMDNPPGSAVAPPPEYGSFDVIMRGSPRASHLGVPVASGELSASSAMS